jgi:hypothetical protein
MKFHFLFLLLIVTVPIFGQNHDVEEFKVKYENLTIRLGMGLLKLDYSKEQKVEIFNDSKFDSKYADWDSEQPNMEIYPKFYELDYGICDFVCLEVSNNYYKILIGFNQVKYVKPSGSWKLTTWKDLIENSFGVTKKRDSRVANKLRISKSDDSDEISLELKTHENFCVKTLEGNWLNVKYDCIYATDEYMEFEGQPCFKYIDNCDNDNVGWIKWRHNNELLVQINLNP